MASGETAPAQERKSFSMGNDEKQQQPDPTLVAQTQQQQALDTQQVQLSLGAEQQNLWSMFGSGSQLSYITLPGSSGAPTAAPAPGQTSNVTGAPAAGAK